MFSKAISFQEVVHDIFPSKNKLKMQKSMKSETPLIKPDASIKLSENSIENFPNTTTLTFRRTTSSIIFVKRMLKKVHSFQQKPPLIDINLNLNNPLDLEKAKILLKKRKETRTAQEIKILAKAFENMDLFREIKSGVDPVLYERLFKELLFEKFPSNTFIFQINDPPDKLYIVLSGEVSILIPKESSSLNSFEKLSGRKMISLENTTFPGYVIMNIMHQFQSFGEIALRNNAARTASAACTSTCELISLDYKTFHVVLKAFFDSQASEKLDNLRKLPIFKLIPNQSLQGLLIHLKEKKYNKKDVIYQEGSKLDCIYIIKEGEVQASKLIDFKNLKNRIIENKCDSKEKMLENLNRKDLEKFKELNSSWARKLFQENKKHQILYILSKGQSFGEKGLITHRNQEDFSMICRSPEAVLYILPYEKILENLKHFDEVFDLQVKSSHEKMREQKAFISKVIYTEGVILEEMNKQEENLEEKDEEIAKDLEGACIRNFRPEKQAYELRNKAKYHYTTRYLPSNLLLKTELEERKEKGFKEFTLEKNLVKMFNPTRVLRKTKNFNKNNSSNLKEIVKGNSNLIRTFTEIVKDLEVKTEKNMPDVILYKSLKVKDEAVQKVYKYCSKKLQNSNVSMGKIRKEKGEEKGLGKKKGEDCLYNFI